jgi:Zn-finger nucleic acid-binding protein
MDCPLCHVGLREIVYEGAGICTCDACGGEFIAGRDLAHIVSTRDAKFDSEVLAEAAGREPLAGVPAEQRCRALDCPGCGSSMSTVNYGGDSGVFVDRCRACDSLWLDAAELEHVQAISERWQDEASTQLRALAAELESSRRATAERLGGAFTGSRFAFVNALINRVLSAA